MTEETKQPGGQGELRALSLGAMPLYSMFFLWGVGTGAQQLGRPLFAAAFGVPVFFVTLIGAVNSASWLITAPLTGFLTDRFGRRPLMIIGNFLRGSASGLQFFSTNYWQFFAFELMGAIGVSMFNTGSSIVMADITERENRGRANAIRGMSTRFGAIAGPLIGALLVPAFGLRALFMFNFITKIPIHLLMTFRIRETRPEAARSKAGTVLERADERLGLSVFLVPAVIVVAMATLAHSMVGFQGVMGTLFPLHVEAAAGLEHSDVGTMMSLAGTATLLISYPNGMIVDRYGRKKSMVVGLLLLGISGFLLAQVGDYLSVVVMILIYGIGEGVIMGSTEAFAMDLAPTRGRGAFLGIWSLFRNIGGIFAPLIIGTVAQTQGLSMAFVIVATLLTASGLLVAIFGRESSSVRAAHT